MRFVRLRFALLLALPVMLTGCAFFTADITGVEAARIEEEEMNDAIARAQATLEHFTTCLEDPDETQIYFAVRARFDVEELGGFEDLWIEEVSWDGEQFTGALAGEPQFWEGAVLGDSVTAPNDAVIDWMIVEETRIVGAYTVRVERDRLPLLERIDFSRQLGLPIVDPE